ncbi:MAG: hypothetical protein EBX09_08115 [Actinobacteria bacterium]|jgi:hypothetical protein|nr:hypothetical protein [Actinomycetota bacterium]
MSVDFSDKCGILGQFWFEFREDEKLAGFIEYNDVGLPLAWFIATGLVTPTDMAEDYINETFNHFIAALDLTDEEIKGCTTLDEILSIAADKKDIDLED